MNAALKRDADALWSEVMSRAGLLERRALSRRKEMFYELIGKHFGPRYDGLEATRKGWGE